MTAAQYVEMILAKYAVPRGSSSPAELLGVTIAGPVRTWAGQQLKALEYSGSYAKGTGVRGISDVDIFISLKSDTSETLKEIYKSLFELALRNGWSPRAQNVSVGVTVNGTRGDLVPGRSRRAPGTITAYFFASGTLGRRPMYLSTRTPYERPVASKKSGQSRSGGFFAISTGRPCILSCLPFRRSVRIPEPPLQITYCMCCARLGHRLPQPE